MAVDHHSRIDMAIFGYISPFVGQTHLALSLPGGSSQESWVGHDPSHKRTKSIDPAYKWGYKSLTNLTEVEN